ncbi:trypsin-like peptidase domain-containing protein [Flavobacteriaceae bacterium]|nr:trypsin-like peptidase domain-containing protein [Flavobacteriaceae bacterium]
MKKFMSILFVSALGGGLTLSTYKLFIETSLPYEIAEGRVLTTTAVSGLISLNSIEETVNFTSAAEKTLPTVVHVKNTTLSKGYTSYEDLFFGRSQQRAQIGTGSGVIISSDGYIITNNHVIEGAQSIEITTNDNKTYTAELIGTDSSTDIALLKIKPLESLSYLTIGDSNLAKVGEWVLAVGNPFNLTSTVTAGIISAKSRDLSGQNTQSFIQTDAAVNPGNSGGALVNTNGELIGINTAITSKTGSYIGYSFAVPSNIARKVIEDLMEFGNVQNGILGVIGGELNSKNSKEFGVNETEGFYVNDIQKGTGAEKAGLQKGDIIQRIDGVTISKFSDLKGFLNTKNPNDTVEVLILRGDKQMNIIVTLEKRISIEIPIIGALQEPEKKALKAVNLDYGLEVVSLSENNRKDWESDGIFVGSFVTEINDISINSINDAQRALEKYSNKVLRLSVVKNNGEKVVYRFR